MSLVKRITFLIDHYDGGVQMKFADRIKVSRSIISRIVTEGENPGGKVLLNIVEYLPDVNTEWLFKNRGEPFVQDYGQDDRNIDHASYVTRTKLFIRERLIEQLGQIQAMIDRLNKDLSDLNEDR